MEKTRKPKRFFTAEQKFDILQTIETDLKNGMQLKDAVEKSGIGLSLHRIWKKKLSIGVKSSLRSGNPPPDKAMKQMERRIAKLEAIILSQSQTIAELKKETNWG